MTPRLRRLSRFMFFRSGIVKLALNFNENLTMLAGQTPSVRIPYLEGDFLLRGEEAVDVFYYVQPKTDRKRHMKLKNFFKATLLAAVIFFAVAPVNSAEARHRYHKPRPDRSAELVMDASSGTILLSHNVDARRYPASLTKLMTLYLTFEALENGTLTKNQRLSISTHAQYQSPSKLGLKAGYTIRAEDAILALVTKSANDAAVVLGESLANGSEKSFADMMNRKARQLGMSHTHFRNASGLPDKSQYTTARDMAHLAQALIRDFPRYYHYFSTPSFTYAGIEYPNHDKLLETYAGADGMKTGYIYASGYNLVSSARRNGHRIIGVVFGGKTAASRNKTMARLLDTGFARINEPRIARLISNNLRLAANDAVPRHKPVATPVGLRHAATVAEVATAADTADASATQVARGETPFDAMSLVPADEQGDGAAEDDSIAANRIMPAKRIRTAYRAPVGMLDAARGAQQAAGTWAVQVGAFSSHDASLFALRNAREQLPDHLSNNSVYVIAPLMTNRGVIYRARLAGFDRAQAAYVCRVLQGNCLILAVQ
ncbi:MAG: D-alanyl-D-alanine carboxypeptidase [Alphaproteobacteria bacterium]|nr:D-alanyl-D-alanine carboxypeptidase [Alphaproteobacteria bacterium]